MRCCQEYARAAAGLPPIEPGMPEPAGTGLTRRTFVLRSAGLGLTVYGLGRLRAFEMGVAEAQAAPPATALLTVYLEGGADGLSVLAPVADPRYRRLRPTLAVSGGHPFDEDPRLEWHPAAAPLAALHAEGKLTALPAAGYADADQSHFTSRHFWEVGALDSGLRTGWLGRLIDAVGSPENPMQGISLDGHLSPALASARNPVAAIAQPEDAGFWTPGTWGPAEELAIPTISAIGRALQGSPDPALAQAASAAAFAGTVRDALARFGSDGKPAYAPAVAYPRADDEFPRQLAGFAAMLGANLPIRAAAVHAPGAWDTHADQAEVLTRNL